MKKKINTDAIKNELAGSVFFPAKPQELPQSLEPDTKEQTSFTDRFVPSHQLPFPEALPQPVPRTPVPPTLNLFKNGGTPRRKIKQRHPFDIFADQLVTMKKIVEDERTQGLPGSMSRMVREAIDAYLKEKYNK